MRWSKPLVKSFVSPRGKPIKTLDDARKFLASLPKSRDNEPDVRAAAEAVWMAANGTGPVLHATVGIGRLLNQTPKSSSKPQ